MKGKNYILLLLLLITTMTSCRQEIEKGAIFYYFQYEGQDARFNRSLDAEKEYYNPILSGFYPDPSICRKGDDYYLVTSSFSYYPGIPIFHSKDLVSWRQIGHVLDRPSQLTIDNIRLSGGIYAPAISYNANNDTFYLVTTCVDCDGNFVVKTQDPMQGWSDPIFLPRVGGIDPALFFDEDGKAYLVHNDAPEGEPEYDGHRAIWIHEYDTQTDQTVGDPQVLVDGGVDKSTHPSWIEGPHIYKVEDTYYLMAAEGGTAENHSEVIFTSEHVKGPYKPAQRNPILTQRNLPADRPEKVTSVGHADLIQTSDNSWYAVFLGCRPYEGDMYNTGRETFLLPVSWEEGIPVILESGAPVPSVVSPIGWRRDTGGVLTDKLTGNFTWRDEFISGNLANEWIFIRTPKEEWWKAGNGKLTLIPTEHGIYSLSTPAFIGRRQQHLSFTATTEMKYQPENSETFAGLVCYQNEKYNIIFGKTLREGKEVIEVISSADGKKRTEGTYALSSSETGKPVQLRIRGEKALYSFELSFDGNNWKPVASQVDATILSTQKAGGFTGCIIGMYTGSLR